jgi:Flp pilus assembly protein CpaB
MNTARIIVLMVALSAGGVAAYRARGSDAPPAPAAPVAQLPTVDVLVAKSDIGLGQTVTLALKPEQSETLARARLSGTLSLALRSISDINMVENNSGDQPAKRGETVSVVRYGVSGSTTTQK